MQINETVFDELNDLLYWSYYVIEISEIESISTLCHKGRKWAISSEGVRYSAWVGSRTPKAPETETGAENTSPDSEIAFLPVLHTIFFLTKVWQGLFYECELERGLGRTYTMQLKIKIIWNVYAINYTSLKGGRNIHYSPVLGCKWMFLTTFMKYARNAKFSLLPSHVKRAQFHTWVEKKHIKFLSWQDKTIKTYIIYIETITKQNTITDKQNLKTTSITKCWEIFS